MLSPGTQMNTLDLAAGTVFGGDFRIVRPLRVGGMGAVYVAEQRSTGAQRALKLMQRELVGDPSLRERFEQEARVGATIDSDHVVQVIGAGVDGATGIPWIAMELLRGVALDEYIAMRQARCGICSSSCVTRSGRRIRAGSCTAISSHRTCSSARRGWRGSRTS